MNFPGILLITERGVIAPFTLFDEGLILILAGRLFPPAIGDIDEQFCAVEETFKREYGRTMEYFDSEAAVRDEIGRCDDKKVRRYALLECSRDLGWCGDVAINTTTCSERSNQEMIVVF